MHLLATFIPSAHAQNFTTLIPTANLTGCDFNTGDFTWACFPLYIAYLANVVITFTLTICLILLIYNGYRYAIGPVLGQGTNEGAKKGIFYALVGTTIALMAYIIVDVIFTALNSGI